MIVECSKCEAFVEAEEIGEYGYPAYRGDLGGRYVLLKCKQCKDPLLVLQENLGNLPEGDIWDSPVRLYPAEDSYVNPKIPKPLQDSYREGRACFKAKAYTAATIMARKTIEGVCVTHNTKGRSLVQSLQEMKDSGLLDERLYEWADALRISGNEAAHDVNVSISREDASDILDLTQAILDYLFSFRDKFEEFKKRRGSAR